MPDDPERKDVGDSAETPVTKRDTPIPAQVPPNPPNPPAAQPIGHDNVQGEVKNLEDRIKKAEIWMIGLTAAIALFALGSIIVGSLQWCAMKGQLKEMQSGSVDTHKLAESTLAASRAWLVVQATGFGFTKDKGFPSGRVVLADSGESPAFGLQGWRCVEVRKDEPPMQSGVLQKSPTAVCLPISGGTLGKGVPITMDAFVPSLPHPGFSKDTEGTGPHFFYWGTVTYDIYPSDGKRHLTSFCLKNGGDQLSACREGGYQAD